jgi:hypothetical protein
MSMGKNSSHFIPLPTILKKSDIGWTCTGLVGLVDHYKSAKKIREMSSHETKG